ncbi:MAG: hypothetical protein ACI9YB_001911, partial [Halioglobus sp.]
LSYLFLKYWRGATTVARNVYRSSPELKHRAIWRQSHYRGY